LHRPARPDWSGYREFRSTPESGIGHYRDGAGARCRAFPGVDTTIVGTRSVEHLQANIDAALKGPLPAEVVQEAKRRLGAAGSRPE
jgi:hypothetical protein